MRYESIRGELSLPSLQELWQNGFGILEKGAECKFRGLMAMEGGHMIPGQGALPVYRNGELIGAVGGSGGTAQQDEDAARAGIDAIGLSTAP